jgi:excisionase family DNA binding protein
MAETKQVEAFENGQGCQQDRLLTIRQVSEMTGLAVGTLYHFASEAKIPVVRLSKRCIRFRYSDLLNWIASLTCRERDS